MTYKNKKKKGEFKGSLSGKLIGMYEPDDETVQKDPCVQQKKKLETLKQRIERLDSLGEKENANWSRELYKVLKLRYEKECKKLPN